MENESEAIFNEDNDQNLVIDDGDYAERDEEKEEYTYNETFDPDYVQEDDQTEKTSEKQIEEIKTSMAQKGLSPSERGKKLAELNKFRRGLGIAKKKPKSLSKKSGVIFPVKRVLENLKKMLPEKIISQQAGVYLASVLEYMCSEVLDLSGEVARQVKKKRITPHFIQLSITGDEELHKLLKNTIIAQGGVTPYIHPELLVTKSRYQKRPRVETEAEQEVTGPQYKKISMIENASQTEPLEEITTSRQVDDASQTDIFQSNEMLSPDVTIIEEKQATPEKMRNFSLYQKINSLPKKSIEQPDITSAQMAPVRADTDLELSEINSQIENITGINLERASTPMHSEEASHLEDYQSGSSNQNIEIHVNREQSLETILETENRGNNSDKNASINIESYLNVQASSEKFIDKLLNNKPAFVPPMPDVSLQKILKPLENHILITDRKIVPNVVFKKSKYPGRRSRNSENFYKIN